MDKKTLKQVIEDKRNELNQVELRYGVLDPIVLSKSKELDELLNQFQKCNSKKCAVI